MPRKTMQETISNMRRQIYYSPLGKKCQHVVARPQPPGPVKQYTEEELYLENLKRLSQVKGGAIQ